MGDGHLESDNGRLGRYLRHVRESRRLSLDAVAEMTLGYPGRVTKSHLSRIENGRAEPSFPKLYALSQVYGVPIAAMAETFEVDQRRKAMPEGLTSLDDAELYRQANRLRLEGRQVEALMRLELLLERRRAAPEGADAVATLFQLRIRRISCLVALDRYNLAKEDCEDLLTNLDLQPNERVLVLHHFARCCYRLGKFTIASMAIERAESELPVLDDAQRIRARLLTLKGDLAAILGDAAAAAAAFREALELFVAVKDRFEVCRQRMNYGVALGEHGKTREARRQLQLALKGARAEGYDRQAGYALHALGKLTWQEGDAAAAESWLLESNAIARDRQYLVLVFCNCFWLWKVAESRGDAVGARAHRRTLRAYVHRIPETIPEAREFRRLEAAAGGDA